MNILLKHPKYEVGRVVKVTHCSEMVRILHAEPGVGQHDEPQYKALVVGPESNPYIGRAFMFPESYLEELPPLIELAIGADD